MRGWWATNWDKVAIVIFSPAMAGVIGFFSGIAAVQNDIASLRERAAALEAEVANLKPLNSEMQKANQRLSSIEDIQELLKQRADVSAETKSLIELTIENSRRDTVKELRAMILEAKK